MTPTEVPKAGSQHHIFPCSAFNNDVAAIFLGGELSPRCAGLPEEDTGEQTQAIA